MKRDIRLSVTYPHPPARVWRALTTSQAIAAWLMPNDFVPEVGRAFTMRTEPALGFDGVVHCEVLTLEPERSMSWSWRGGPIDTVVTFRLEPEGQGTRLYFEQTGFEGLPALLVSVILGQGSKRIYRQRLPEVLDRMARGEGFGAVAPEGCEGSVVEKGLGKAVGALSGPGR
ncbi:MAG: SRPBCC domain-containing protein [Alphaproteobacteria bacterium]|nr:SRPBCC domain-containing protein [Alphaproteobacteria bacterium]